MVNATYKKIIKILITFSLIFVKKKINFTLVN
jgi:hypothetical protein